MHATVKPTGNKIRIKTEDGNAVDLKISAKKNIATSSPRSRDWDKNKLVQKIVDLKAENEQNVLTLKRKTTEYDLLMSEKQKNNFRFDLRK